MQVVSSFKHWGLIGIIIFIGNSVCSQNVTVNLSARNGGKVRVGDILQVELWINNTKDQFGAVLPYRIKPQINFTDHLQLADSSSQELPEGWAIVEDKKGMVRLTNGSDTIPSLSRRIIVLGFKAIKECSGEKIIANLTFSGGIPPGNQPGPTLRGDNPADNSNSVIIKISR